ncbi:MAG: UDP-2,3-diacylglucosamine diphosphatase [Bacteroidota bacterium]
MILFLSDLHLGRGTPAESRAAERDVCALLDAHADALDALVLVGDVFDAYMEYRHLVPKGFVRLQGRLAALVDAGVPVTYVVGNRDPWHLDHFAREVGVRLVRDHVVETMQVHGTHGVERDESVPWRVYIAHGDGRIAHDRLYNRIRPLMHHPAVARLYRMLLPGDTGYALARWTGRRAANPLGRDRTGPDLPAVTALRRFARQTLAAPSSQGALAPDLVVCGHVHLGECTTWGEGTYLNPGYWFGHRTFGRLDADGPALLHWDGAAAHPCHVRVDGEAFVIERTTPTAPAAHTPTTASSGTVSA